MVGLWLAGMMALWLLVEVIASARARSRRCFSKPLELREAGLGAADEAMSAPATLCFRVCGGWRSCHVGTALGREPLSRLDGPTPSPKVEPAPGAKGERLSRKAHRLARHSLPTAHSSRDSAHYAGADRRSKSPRRLMSASEPDARAAGMNRGRGAPLFPSEPQPERAPFMPPRTSSSFRKNSS